MSKKLGDWRWYCGTEPGDDAMADCGSKDDAIAFGQREHYPHDQFFIIEARICASDEEAMGAGKIDAAPFARQRFGTWCSVQADGSVTIEDAP